MARFKDLIAGKRLYFHKHQAYLYFNKNSYFPCFVVICWLKECSNSEKKKVQLAPCGSILPATPMVVTSIVGVTVIIASRASSWSKTWCKSTFFTISRNTSMPFVDSAIRYRASGKFSDLDFFLEIKNNKRWLMVFGDVRTEPNYTYTIQNSCLHFMPPSTNKIFNKS